MSRLRACELADGVTARVAAPTRSSTGCWLPRHDCDRSAWRSFEGVSHEDIGLLKRVELYLADACGLPPCNGEPAQVLRYRTGQRYDVHPDFFDPRDSNSLANGGQRVATCLLYLTTLPRDAGGCTSFPRARVSTAVSGLRSASHGLRVRPVAGRAIVFHNTRPDGGIDPMSIHAGEPVRGRRGAHNVEKWLLSKWMRQREYHVDGAAGF